MSDSVRFWIISGHFPKHDSPKQICQAGFEATIFMLLLSDFQITTCIANIYLSACACAWNTLNFKFISVLSLCACTEVGRFWPIGFHNGWEIPHSEFPQIISIWLSWLGEGIWQKERQKTFKKIVQYNTINTDPSPKLSLKKISFHFATKFEILLRKVYLKSTVK